MLLMNMSQEVYKEELNRQIDNCHAEVKALSNDYQKCTDNICKSQIRTLLEKKEHTLIDLLKRRIDNGYTN